MFFSVVAYNISGSSRVELEIDSSVRRKKWFVGCSKAITQRQQQWSFHIMVMLDSVKTDYDENVLVVDDDDDGNDYVGVCGDDAEDYDDYQ